MIANLKLVVSSGLLPQSTFSMASQSAGESMRNLVVANLVPRRHQDSAQTARQRPAYWMLNIVILAHVAGLALLMSGKPNLHAIREPLIPITVSLVNKQTTEPEVVSLQPAQQLQPVIEKTIVKQTLQTAEPVAEQPFVTQQAVVSEMSSTPTTPVVGASAAEAVEVAQPKVEHESIIEPPRFGAAYLHNPAPDYPPLARRLGEQGRVLLRVLVSVNGDTDKVQIETSSGSNKLDQAAIQAVKRWNFIPAKRSNQPISAYVLVPVQFSLEG